MKIKSEICASLLVLFACLCLTACYFKTGENYRIDTEAGTVQTIEIFSVNDGATYIDEGLSPVASVPSERFDEFMEKFHALHDFKQTVLLVPGAVDPNFSYVGYVVKITYESGASEEINNHGVQNKIDANGKTTATTHFELDDEEWEPFIQDFLDTPDTAE